MVMMNPLKQERTENSQSSLAEETGGTDEPLCHEATPVCSREHLPWFLDAPSEPFEPDEDVVQNLRGFIAVFGLRFPKYS